MEAGNRRAGGVPAHAAATARSVCRRRMGHLMGASARTPTREGIMALHGWHRSCSVTAACPVSLCSASSPSESPSCSEPRPPRLRSRGTPGRAASLRALRRAQLLLRGARRRRLHRRHDVVRSVARALASRGLGGGRRGHAPGPPADPPAESCGADSFVCAEANVIEGCLDGQPFSLSCDIVCDDLPSDGCRYDAEADSDLCICLIGHEDPEPQPEPDPPGPAPGE